MGPGGKGGAIQFLCTYVAVAVEPPNSGHYQDLLCREVAIVNLR